MCDEVRCIVSKLLLWISLWPENRQVSIYERACVGTWDGMDSTMHYIYKYIYIHDCRVLKTKLVKITFDLWSMLWIKSKLKRAIHVLSVFLVVAVRSGRRAHLLSIATRCACKNGITFAMAIWWECWCISAYSEWALRLMGISNYGCSVINVNK